MDHLPKRPAIILAAIAAFSSAPTGRAADFYIAQTALGTGTGTDATDAMAVGFFNASGHWSSPTKVSGKIGPGDTVHLCGTITTALTVQAGGTPGNAITVLFASSAKMSAPTWQSGYAINIGSNSYVTIDGGATGLIGGLNGNPSLANGIIECTANGTGLANANSDGGIGCYDCSNVTVKGLLIRNIYVRAAGSDDANANGVGFFSRWNGNAGSTNITCTNCIFHDMASGVLFSYGPAAAAFEMSYCTSYNCNWGGAAGGDGGVTPSTLTGLLVHDCYFYNWQAWSSTDSTSAGDAARNSLHHNGFFGWADTNDTLTGTTCYNNFFGPGYGSTQQTSGLFVQGNAYGTLIYNNTFFADSTGNPADGMIYAWIASSASSEVDIYNNTIVGAGYGNGINVYSYQDGAPTTYHIRNNLISGMGTAVASFYNTDSILDIDYNIGYNLLSGQGYSNSSTGSGSFLTFAQWQAAGFDLHGSSGNPNLNGNYVPQPPSAAIGRGINLSPYFTTDMAGNSRPQSPAAWDIGAYEYVIPQAATPTFSPPAGTYATAQSVAIVSTTSGATIRYTTDGSTPTETDGVPYSGPVSINTTTVLSAIAYRTGFSDSPVASGSYMIGSAPTPTPTPTPTPAPTPAPTSPPAGGGGGGGAPSYWFLGLLALAGILRWRLRQTRAV